MAAEPPFKSWREYVGRFSVEIELTNHEDAIQAKKGSIPPEQVRRARISGVVDTGASRLVLPASVVTALGVPDTGQTGVRFADGRREIKKTVGDVELAVLGRSGVFSAVVEPGRTDALIGAIVLEELDLLPDCSQGVLIPRDPDKILTEIEICEGIGEPIESD